MLVAPFKSADAIARGAAEILRPPRRVTPTEAAAFRLTNEKGAWDPGLTPYICEPLDTLADRRYQGIVNVGPARTGKTFGLVIGGVYYVVTVSPGDMTIVHVSEDKARKFSRTDLDRTIQHTPELQMRLSPRAQDDNVHDKFFRSGISLGITWPSARQLSGDTLQYVLLTDYDRPDNADNVDHEGSLWSQAFKRIETYLSRGKCVAESSPGKEYSNGKWLPRTPHEAPPAPGIAALYNAGTRARWYWRCMHCHQHFEAAPGLKRFAMPEFDELKEAVQTHDLMMLAESFAKVCCPQCGGVHEPHQKSELNAIDIEGHAFPAHPRVLSERHRVLGAWWLHEGERLVDGRFEGERRRTNIASYWLGGCAAAYQPWVGLIHKYLAAVVHFVRTGEETELKSSSHMDQAWPYLSRHASEKRSADELSTRGETWVRGVVPVGVRFLLAVVDVQAHRFVVQIHGMGVGLQSWLIERFSITASNRKEDEEKHAALDPAAYAEDWEVLIDRVLERSYRLDGQDLVMLPILVGCDSGGKEGVTEKAYDFYRSLRRRQKHQRFRLLKGTGNQNAPRAQQTMPDSRGRKDRTAGGKGDVPVWLLNVNVLKDGVVGDLARTVSGPGYVHIPEWVDAEYFDELAAETKGAKGWKSDGSRNEAFDLHGYARGLCVMLGADKIDWTKPPAWADEWERNPNVRSIDAPTTPLSPPPMSQGTAGAQTNPFARRDGRGFRR